MFGLKQVPINFIGHNNHKLFYLSNDYCHIQYYTIYGC